MWVAPFVSLLRSAANALPAGVARKTCQSGAVGSECAPCGGGKEDDARAVVKSSALAQFLLGLLSNETYWYFEEVMSTVP